MINATNNNWLMGHWNNSVDNYYSNGWVSSVGAGGTDNLWRIYHATGNLTSGTWQLYVNGVLYVSGGGGSVGPNGISIGFYGNVISEFSNGDCGFVGAYTRVLTQDEVTSSFNAFRGRYGL